MPDLPERSALGSPGSAALDITTTPGEPPPPGNDPLRLIRPHLLSITLVTMLVLALGLRLFGVNWDQGGLFHPDERAILMNVYDLGAPGPQDLKSLFDAQASPWNPGWFNYGSLPLYLLKSFQILSSPFKEFDLFDLRIPGRVMSALADTAVVGLVFTLGRRWYGTRVGLLAGTLATLAVIGIQLSHFYAVDTLLTLFVVAAVLFMARLAYTGRYRDAAGAGLFAGLAFATKVSALALGAPLIVAFLIFAFSAPGDALAPAERSALSLARRGRALRGLSLAAGVGLLAVIITQPYMFLDFRTFLAHTLEQSQMVRRAIDYPYTRQYIDTPRILYQAWQIGTWGLGPVLGALAWAGVAWAAVRAWRQQRKAELVILAWIVPYLALTLWFNVKFMRYMLPAVPFMLLFGSQMLWQGIDRLITLLPRYRKWVALAALAAVLVPTAHYALSYVTIYSRDHPAVRAAAFLDADAAPAPLILKEHWEEGLPGLGRFRVQELELYNPDFGQKFERIARQLAVGDYLILYSNRLYGTLSRLPDQYPNSVSYYRALFAGQLGYEVVFSAESLPGLLGINYVDDYFGRGGLGPPVGYVDDRPGIGVSFGWADESFTVYDHPRTLVFKNVGHLSETEILDLIGSASPRASGPGLVLTAEEAATQQSGGTWRSIFQLTGDANRYSWIVWLLAVQLIGLAATPLALRVFSTLPGRGYLLAKPLGLLLVALVAWLLASSGLIGFSRLSILLALLLLAAVSTLIAWRSASELRRLLRAHWRSLVALETLFLVAWVAFLLIRVANPDLWHPYRGGEKPMDFAYLNAVTRSTLMPPYDPWFGGGFLNYYYFGQFIVASLIRLTGIAPTVAYNLAVPTLFALTVGGAFTIVYALAESTRRGSGRAGRVAGPVLAGIGAALFVGVIGNIDGAVQVYEGARRALAGGEFGGFDYWRSSRMMAPGSPGNEITEFPFFTFLFADLHAHLIAIPFTLLTAGLALAVFLNAWRKPEARLWGWAALGLLGLSAGALRVINAWDFPGYLLLAALAAGGGEILAGRDHPWRALRMAFVKVLFVAAIGYLAFLPFHARFELFNNGIEASKTQTPLWRYLAIHAPFIAVFLSYLVWQGRILIGQALRSAGIRPEFAALYVAIPASLFVTVAIFGYATVVVAIALILLAGAVAYLQYRADSPAARHTVAVLALVAIAFAIGAGVDLVTVKNDIGRMNTVFKFYLQAWVLMALVSAYLLWRMADAGLFSLKGLKPARGLWIVGLAILFLSTLVYPVLGTGARVADRFNREPKGIDGMAYMQWSTYSEQRGTFELSKDIEGIRWLQRNVDGSPVILEGITELYRWGNRISVYTGLPAVVGWDWHQRQQRVEYDWAVTQRRQDVNTIYSTSEPSAALGLLRKYNVRYIYVGDLERQYYPSTGIEKFERMSSQGVVLVYPGQHVTIYRFDDLSTAESLPASAGGS